MSGLTFREIRAVVVAFIVSCVIVLGGTLALADVRSRQQHANAVTSLQICLQIENIKSRIRTTIQGSIDTLPDIAYYKRRPTELRTAIANAETTLKSFASDDCYNLPEVKREGIKK